MKIGSTPTVGSVSQGRRSCSSTAAKAPHSGPKPQLFAQPAMAAAAPAAEPAQPGLLPYVLLQTSNDSHAHRIYTTLAASENRALYAACLGGRFDCARVLRPYPDTVLLCDVRGTEQDFLALLRDTHIGAKVFRVYFCGAAAGPAPDAAAAVAAFYGERADGLVCRMQCYPRSVEAAMGKTIPMGVDLRMSGFSVVGSVVKLPADQLLPAQQQQEGAAAEGAAQGGSGSEDRNVPWRLRKKQKRTDKKHKKHKQSKWEAAAGPKAAAAADAAAASAAAAKKGGSAGGAAEEEIEEDEELGNTVEADLSEFEAEGAPPVPLYTPTAVRAAAIPRVSLLLLYLARRRTPLCLSLDCNPLTSIRSLTFFLRW